MPFTRYLATLDEIPALLSILGMAPISETHKEFYDERDGAAEAKRETL